MILRAIEDKRFMPVGSDKEASSDFQLIAGTNRDLRKAARAGDFREDLLARLDLWTYTLPGLRDRREDIESNVEYELRKYGQASATNITFNKEALRLYLGFAKSARATWLGNFRDLGASITRMATLADSGRINTDIVEVEIARLQSAWAEPGSDEDALLINAIGQEHLAEIDLFDRAQLATVIRTCQQSASLSAAGRELFAVSRLSKASSNDADRLKKYLGKFDLNWAALKE